MTRNAWLGLNVCLLAAVLLDASAARTSVAEEGHAKSDQKSEHQPAHNPEGGRDEHGPAEADHHSTRPDGHDHDRADTHVGFEPNGPTRRDAAKDVRDKLRSFTHGNLRQHRILAPPAGGVARNAIGVTLPPHEVGSVTRMVVHGPAAAPGLGIGANSPNAKPSNGFHPVLAPRVVVAPANRATIAGTAMTKPGTSSSGIGGPAKAVVGINGSKIKPRY